MSARLRALFALLREVPTTKLRTVVFVGVAVIAVAVHLGCMVRGIDLTKGEVTALYVFIAACLGIAGVAQEVKRATIAKGGTTPPATIPGAAPGAASAEEEG